jgi:hypothetical protein
VSTATRWLVLVAASSAIAVSAAIASTGDARSMIPLLWFLAAIPGLPYVLMLRSPDDPVAFWLVVVGLSVAIDALVAEALLYASAYSAITAVGVLAGVACAGALIGRLRSPARASEPAR